MAVTAAVVVTVEEGEEEELTLPMEAALCSASPAGRWVVLPSLVV